MFEVRIYGRTRAVPFKKQPIFLSRANPLLLDDKKPEEKEILDHLRKFDRIEIRELEEQKSVRSMKLQELRALATQKGVDWAEADSRNQIMKKLRGV
jgi:hypothetical protein